MRSMSRAGVRTLRGWILGGVCCAVALVKAAELPWVAAEAVGMSSEHLGRIDQVINRHIDAGNIQGAVTAVARHGQIVHFKAHGLMDVDNRVPMTEDAMFIMMSSTKPVLGVAAMIAMEEGWFRPNDPVSNYIPEFKDMQVAVLADPVDEDISPLRVDRENVPAHRLVSANREITIHDLLTHTAGLHAGGLGTAIDPPGLDRWTSGVTLATFIPTLGEAVLDFQPGTRWSYSGITGLDVVARVIEIVSGQPYDEFVQSRILDPVGMVDTHYNVPPRKKPRRVQIMERDNDRFDYTTPYFSGSIGFTSTARDYLRFEQMLLNGGTLDGNRVLSPHSVARMASNQLDALYQAPGNGFGYTVAVMLDPIAAHSARSEGAFGWGGAFGTRSWTDPEAGIAGVIMLQQRHVRTQVDFEHAVRHAIID